MPETSDVSAIAQQVKAHIKHIEDQLQQHHGLTDELERPRRFRRATVALGMKDRRHGAVTARFRRA